MSPDSVGFAIVLLATVMLIGKYLRVKVPFVQKLLLPSSIVAGFIGLFLGPEIAGRIGAALDVDWLADGGFFTEDIVELWSTLPGLLISVVFATLFLGSSLPSPKRVAKLAGPQLSIGIAYGSGQYVVGLLIGLLVLAPFFGLEPFYGGLIEIAFEGGHGTAAGMAPAFEDMGIPEATDLALAMATVGLVSGIIIGVSVINWGVRTGRTEVLEKIENQSASELRGLYSDDETVYAGRMTARPGSIEPLTLHVAVIGLAIIIGWLMLEGLVLVEDALWGQPDSLWVGEGEEGMTLLGYVPLFPLAMLGGVVVQLVLDRTGNSSLLDAELMQRIQGLALDILIVAALSTISLAVIADYWQAFVILSVAGIAFCTVMLVYFTPRIIPQFWLERGIADFGQSMGVTATGLALLRVADPNDESPALEAFGYKQLAFEPIFGGGLITAISIPVMVATGNVYIMLIPMAILFVLALTGGIIYHRGVKSGRWTDPSVEAAKAMD
ncbi:sodium/glutamate symporter [Nesterenkonia aerolata]|uniref:Sodium/glutamate symporter n=1 Tax=Nesterenkonia aerolata TaxID=3074079 RepID=A0ABU2DP68_9MICC|nr:sodium/glutamate symporter [Nesterenkonia sp. LY-0111]MDR8018304.1 sodium/glutamate symporter [Nesterenkonia sp. LY-0111]